MTGGLQDQVTDGENWYGKGLKPSSKAIIGSQDVPYIYEDRLNKDDFLEALTEMYEMDPIERATIGARARQWTQKQFNFGSFTRRWDDLLTEIHEKNGSWDTRQNYTSYDVKEY